MRVESAEEYEEYVSLVRRELGIELDRSMQDGLGQCPDPDRIDDFCHFYLGHPAVHPIRKAESVDQVLGSLSMRFENGAVTKNDLDLVSKVVRDAASNIWAATHLIASPNMYNPDVDPGDYAVNEWLLNESGLDMTLLEAQRARFQDPKDNLE